MRKQHTITYFSMITALKLPSYERKGTGKTESYIC